MPSTRHLLGATVAAATLLTWGGSAFAYTVAINEGSIQRSTSFRSTSQNPLWISKADCLADDVISFPATVDSVGSDQLEVWVGKEGVDCTTSEARTGSNPTCWKVWANVPTSAGVQILVRVQDIVAGYAEVGEYLGTGTAAACVPTDASTGPKIIELYFMYMNGTEVRPGGTKWSTKLDLVGPTAPTKVSAGVGDTIIVVDWTPPVDTDRAGYRFYCDPIPGKEDEQTNITPLDDASTGITFKAGDADVDADTDADVDAGTDADVDAGTDADVDAGTDADVDADTDASVDAGTDAAAEAASTGSGSCPTTALIAGDDPNEAYYCGSGSGTSGKITGLKNGVYYSVAVAGVDGVGNIGKLSNVTCATPSPVDDFFKVYREAGGQGGGGFCAASGGVGHGAGVSGLFLLALAALGGTLRRRRGT